MGMYTEFHFNSEIKDDPVVLSVLGYMLDNTKPKPTLPDHSLFECGRWPYMLNNDSYYFDADTHSTLRYDDCGCWYLCIRCNLKNYNKEIQLFIDWIMPYLERYEGEFLGFYRYEETEEPTLLYMGG